MMVRKILLAAVLALAAAGPGPVHAMASSDDAAPKRTAPADYGEAEKAVKAGEYATAVPMLEKIVAADRSNADAYNYLAFSQRKLGQFENALANYQIALQIDPKHRGAHEYLGELYVEMNEMDRAREMLASLKSICGTCEEVTALEQAIEKGKGY